MINHQYLTRRSDLFSTVTGFTLPQFRQLLDKFASIYYQKQSNRIPEEKRKRKMGGGRKSLLGGIDGKLFFILFYHRNYPTLRFAQVLFEIEDLSYSSLGDFPLCGFERNTGLSDTIARPSDEKFQ